MTDDIIDRCCAKCGEHFDGTTECDYCFKCYNEAEGFYGPSFTCGG